MKWKRNVEAAILPAEKRARKRRGLYTSGKDSVMG